MAARSAGHSFFFRRRVCTNYLTAAPLLEKYGFQGMFLLPSDWIDYQGNDQKSYAKKHAISASGAPASCQKLAMTWNQATDLLNRGHLVVSHTRSYHRFSETDPLDFVQNEVFESRRVLETRLGRTIDTFSWVGGEEFVYQPHVFEEIQKGSSGK